MAYRFPPLNALRAFESAARHLSFRRAAEELSVTPAAISQQIKLLESFVGQALFVRRTRALDLTPAGLAMLPKIRAGFDCLAEALATTQAVAATSLTVTAPPSFASRWLVPRLPRFYAAHPEISLRLASSSDSVDRPGRVLRGMRSPRDAGDAVAIRYGTGHYPGLQAEELFAPRWLPVCAPALLAGETPLRQPEDLAAQTLIHDETIDAEGERPGWSDWLRRAGVAHIDARKGVFFSNAVLAVEAALAGQGVALALEVLVAADIAAGRLMVPFSLTIPSPYAYFLVASVEMRERPAVAAFRSWLLGEVGVLPAG